MGIGADPGDNASIHPLAADREGYFSAVLPAVAGDRYRFRLDDDGLFPDPASRFQPVGPHGPSELVDPSSFRWTDDEWAGVGAKGTVLYELHIGTFTREGTWEAAAGHLVELAAAGLNVLEVMPVADFPGRFGWGYDGVNLFAPSHLYGQPDDFRRFVNEAHATGLGVILDVVLNHLGPDGNYLAQYSPYYQTDRYQTEWGRAINFDGEHCRPVRDFYISLARHWIEEYHLDGFRFDAVQTVFDSSSDHILAELGRAARQSAVSRSIILLMEHEAQRTGYLRQPDEGGVGLDSAWNDDFHHAALTALTGHNQAYYSDYRGTPQEFVSAAKWGYLYQGQWYSWQGKRRGTPSLDLPPTAFVNYLENHDQLANSGYGARVHDLTSPGRYRALMAVLLLGPQIPLLFQGQEFGTSTPFVYFADHGGELGAEIHAGRKAFLGQFPGLRSPAMAGRIADPASLAAFEACKLDHREKERNVEASSLVRDLLSLRHRDPLFSRQEKGGVDGAVLGPHAFCLRFFGDSVVSGRLLICNLGLDHRLDPAPEPLLAPPEGRRWRVLWSSEDPRYGGQGIAELDENERWFLPGESTLVLETHERGGIGP